MSEDTRLSEAASRAVAAAHDADEARADARARQLSQADIRDLRKGGAEVLLAGEVTQLSRRMDWLQEHPRAHRRLGGGALFLAYDHDARGHRKDRIATPPLDIQQSYVEGKIVAEGYVFWRFYSQYEKMWHQELYIDRAIAAGGGRYVDAGTEYQLFPYDSPTGPRVQVRDHGPINQFANDKWREARAAYLEREPWAEAFYFMESELSTGELMLDLRGPVDHTRQTQDRREQIRRELAPHLRPGASWEYPEELLYDPLRLVMLANDALGRAK